MLDYRLFLSPPAVRQRFKVVTFSLSYLNLSEWLYRQLKIL